MTSPPAPVPDGGLRHPVKNATTAIKAAPVNCACQFLIKFKFRRQPKGSPRRFKPLERPETIRLKKFQTNV
jgi:hypothetical protein